MYERYKKGSKNLKEEGITLVALVITVIIIIILSTVAISFAFGQNGLINRAEDAKKMYANDTAYTESSVTNVESYIDSILNEVDSGSEQLPSKKISEIVGQGIMSETTHVVDDSNMSMWIPKGFRIADDSAMSINRGVVITDNTNEFVWIPVSDEKILEMYNVLSEENSISLSKTTFNEEETTTTVYGKLNIASNNDGIPGEETMYREPDILSNATKGDAAGVALLKSELGYEGTEAEVLKRFAQDLVDEYVEVYKSVKKYKGFYVGRYELTGTTTNPTVQRNNPVLTADALEANTWYGLKDACNRVVSTEDAKSYMIYGNQWDRIMEWIIDTGARSETEVMVNSNTWGNYSDSIGNANVGNRQETQDSGFSDYWSANNIYDLAGNYYEWTQETFETEHRVHRGGGYWYSGSEYVAYFRDNQPPTTTRSDITARVAMYIVVK